MALGRGDTDRAMLTRDWLRRQGEKNSSLSILNGLHVARILHRTHVDRTCAGSLELQRCPTPTTRGTSHDGTSQERTEGGRMVSLTRTAPVTVAWP